MHNFFIYFSLSLLLSCFETARAQELDVKRPREQNQRRFSVEFVEEISDSKDIEGRKGFGGSLFDFVFGGEQRRITRPIDLIALDSKRLVVLDQGAGAVFWIDKGKKRFRVISGDHFYPSLVGVCSFDSKEVFFTDSREKHLYRLKRKKRPKPIPLAVNLAQPTDLACDKETGEFWIVDTKAHNIVVADRSGAVKKIIGKRGSGPGEFNFPTSIWIGPNRRVYVIDSMNYRVQIFDINGKVLSAFGEAGDSSGYFARPKGIAVDSYGDIYVVDALFHTVQIFDDKGNFLFYFGKMGREKKEFWLPSGIYIDNRNYIYIADSYNSRVQVFRLISHDNDDY